MSQIVDAKQVNHLSFFPVIEDSQKLPLKQPLRCCLKDQEISRSDKNFESIEETPEEELEEVPKKPKIKKKGFDRIVFRTHEEALQMCQDRCLPVAFPCMIQNCDSVVMSMHSLNRHYISIHKVRRKQLTDNKDKLCYTAEKLEEIIQKKSALSAIPDLTRIPNGVLKMEYQSEPATPGGPVTANEPPFDKNWIKGAGSDRVFRGATPQQKFAYCCWGFALWLPKVKWAPGRVCSEESPRHKDRSELELTTPPLIRPPPLDLSHHLPSESLLMKVHLNPLVKTVNLLNIPSTVSISVPTPTRQPLRRKNELSEPPPPVPLLPISKDTVTHSLAPRAFYIATYKTYGLWVVILEVH